MCQCTFTCDVASLGREEDLGLLAVLHVQDACDCAQVAPLLAGERVALEAAMCVRVCMCE